MRSTFQFPVSRAAGWRASVSKEANSSFQFPDAGLGWGQRKVRGHIMRFQIPDSRLALPHEKVIGRRSRFQIPDSRVPPWLEWGN